MPLSDDDKTILDGDKAKAVKNLKRAFSLRKATDFVLPAKRVKIFKDSDLLIRHLNNQCDHARLGVAISKKRVKHAVKRNRVKRIIKETFRSYRLQLPSRDYLVSYRGEQTQIDTPMLNKKLVRFWQEQATYRSE